MSLTRYINFFNEENKEYLANFHKQIFLNNKDYFEKNIKPNVDIDFHKFFIIDRACGRATATVPAHIIDKKIVDFVNFEASKINPNAILKFVTFLKYSYEYGHPQLIPHFDKPSKVPFIIDYQISANKVWPLVIDGLDVIHLDNEALFLNATTVMHWRKPDVFKEGEEVSLIFFSFYDSEMKEVDLYWDKEKINEAYKLYEQQADGVHSDIMKANYKKLLGMW